MHGMSKVDLTSGGAPRERWEAWQGVLDGAGPLAYAVGLLHAVMLVEAEEWSGIGTCCFLRLIEDSEEAIANIQTLLDAPEASLCYVDEALSPESFASYWWDRLKDIHSKSCSPVPEEEMLSGIRGVMAELPTAMEYTQRLLLGAEMGSCA